MLVATRVALLDAREMEERLGQVVAARLLPALDLPQASARYHVVSEAHLAAADRVQTQRARRSTCSGISGKRPLRSARQARARA